MASSDYSIKDIQKVVKLDGIIKNVKLTRLTAPGENYLSLILRADFEVEKSGQTRTINSVAKCLPMSASGHGSDMHIHTMKNEIKWYSEIVPLLTDFAKQSNINLDIYPKYYGSRQSLNSTKQATDKDSVLVFENLIPEGYQNDDRYIGCDFITSKAVLKSLAMFHALPIVIKIKKPEVFTIIKDYLEKSHHGPPPDHNRHNGPPSSHDGKKGPPGFPPGGKRPEDMLFEELIKIPDFAPYITKVKQLLDKPRMGPGHEKLAKEPWNTIKHSDFWVNNVMIHYKNQTEPLIKIVDFQMCSYGSFANDLTFFLLTSVRNDVIRESMDELLRIYYDEFTSILRQANVNLNLNYEEYLEEVRLAATDSEVGHALTFSTIIFGEKGTGVDVAVEEFDPFIHMAGMLKKMNQYQKDKLVLIASEAIKRNWL